jgi:hypothetical protein
MTVATSSGSPGISDAAAKAELVREARVPALRPESEEDDEAISVPSWPRRGIDSTRGPGQLGHTIAPRHPVTH